MHPLISEHQMKKLLMSFLKKLCINRREVAESIAEASKCNTYVETVSNIADSLHRNIDKNYPETISQEFFRFVKPEILKQRFSFVDILVDITEENFYGKHSGLYIHGWTGEKGIAGKIRFFIAAIHIRNITIPFYISILPVGTFKAESIGKVIEYCRSLGLRINSVQFDRGFYYGEIINVLQLNKMKYLIFVPKNKFIKKVLDKTREDCVILHEITYSKNKRVSHVISDHVLLHDYLEYNWVLRLI